MGFCLLLVIAVIEAANVFFNLERSRNDKEPVNFGSFLIPLKEVMRYGKQDKGNHS